MSDKPNDGGPAFPIDTSWPHHPGMSKRFWCATMIMAQTCNIRDNTLNEDDVVRDAMHAFRMADAMLAEEQKGGGE